MLVRRQKFFFGSNKLTQKHQYYSGVFGSVSLPIFSRKFFGWSFLNGWDKSQQKTVPYDLADAVIDCPPGSEDKDLLTRNTSIEKVTEGVGDESKTSYAFSILQRCEEQAQLSGWIPDNELSFLSDCALQLLFMSKDFFGCSWTFSIVGVSLFIRLMMLPIYIGNERHKRKLAAVLPLNDLHLDSLRKAQASGVSEDIRKARADLLAFRKKYDIPLIPRAAYTSIALQGPIFVSVYNAFTEISRNPRDCQNFAFEAPLWLDSLSLPDPYCILPLLAWAIMITNGALGRYVEKSFRETVTHSFNEQDITSSESRWRKYQVHIFGAVGLAAVYLFRNTASGMALYVMTGFLFNLIAQQVLRISTVEILLDLPSSRTAAIRVRDTGSSSTEIKHITDVSLLNDRLKETFKMPNLVLQPKKKKQPTQESNGAKLQNNNSIQISSEEDAQKSLSENSKTVLREWRTSQKPYVVDNKISSHIHEANENYGVTPKKFWF